MLRSLAVLLLCVCLSTASPSKKRTARSKRDLPTTADQLGVVVLHLTRNLQANGQLDLRLSDSQLQAVFDVTKETRVVLHGFKDSAGSAWVSHLTNQLLIRADQNVLVVDWRRIASPTNYFQVVADIPSVAALVAAVLRRLIGIGAPPSSFHLIGHSLGAHLVGYVGAEIVGIGRITGLDPAGQGFENKSPNVRLDPTDAVFVDVIHTNAAPLSQLGLGYINPCGTVDFYPNGGRFQPGCYDSYTARFLAFLTSGKSLFEVLGCDHIRAAHLFTESINSHCQMLATSVTQPCNVCQTAMGYDVNKNATGVYSVTTNSQAPFCIETTGSA